MTRDRALRRGGRTYYQDHAEVDHLYDVAAAWLRASATFPNGAKPTDRARTSGMLRTGIHTPAQGVIGKNTARRR